MLNYNPPIAEVIRFCQTRSKKLLLLLLVAAATPAMAQDFYVISYGSNYLAHNAALDGDLDNATSFNAETCLWTISGNNIIAIAPDGTTGYQLSHTGNYNSGYTLTLAASGQDWSGAEDGSIPYRYLQYSRRYSTNYYLYYNSGWDLDYSNSNGTLHQVTRSTTSNNYAASYTGATISEGASIITATGSNTYVGQVLYRPAYSTTTVTFTCASPSINSSTITGDEPAASPEALDDSWTTSWSVSDNTYGATITSGGVLSVSSLPASGSATVTITLNATKDAQNFTATKQVTLMSAATYADAVDGGTTGVTTTTVTLNDYEDHSWSYYNKEDNSPIRSWNPANVKITYNGNGTGTVQTNNSDTPSTWGADATTVKVGIDADANKFVYYKTLERTDGRTADNPTGRCAYTTIANPFAVRPTYDSDGTSKYRGFYAWRVKTLSGGTIHSAATGGTSYTVGSTINAETEIYFAPSGEYGMTVEFEALWARAYVSTTGAGNHNLGVERNFYVITSSANSNITAGDYPCTYTSIYPNGTTNGTTTATSVTVYKYGGFTAAADSKIEYIILRNNNNSTINAAGHNFTIGRGVSGYNNGACATILQATSDMDEDFKFRIESGQYTYLTYTGGYTYGSSQYQSGGNSSNAYTLFIKSALGCDYDRARGSAGNEHLNITGNVIMGYATTLSSNNNRTRKTLDVTVKSGRFLTSMGDNMGNADAHQSMYMSIAGTQTNVGERSLTIEGGEIANIAGGIDGLNNYNHTYSTNYYNSHTAAYTEAATNWTNNGYRSLTLRMTGGTVKGAIYGGAAKSPASGDRWMVFTGGTVGGWIGSGCNGTENEGGQTYGESFVYVGGNIHVGGYTSNINGGQPGCVFGAGKGYADPNGTSGVMTYGTNLAIADNCVIENDVFGGGNYGYAEINTNLYILGGTVNGSAFGGSNLKQGPVVNITMTGGKVIGGLYGGSNTTGTVAGPVTMQIDGGQVGAADADGQRGNIHGGGYGQNTSVSGNISINLGSCGQTTAGVTVYGDVYGGSALGTVNTNASNTTTVSLYKGTIVGGLYGGGLGSNTVAAAVRGKVRVAVAGGSVVCASDDLKGEAGSGSVFGCNNVNGAPASDVRVDIYRTDTPTTPGSYALHAVYGGGNRAAYSGTPVVAIHGCSNSIEYVYGGGNATNVAGTDVTIWGGTIHYAFGGGNGAGDGNPGANITSGGTHLTIHGGTIDAAFGGSNERGTITGGITVDVKAQQEDGTDTCGNAYSACPLGMDITELYGGGNKAEITTAPEMNLDCSANVHKLFGGAREANFTGDILLEVFGGTYQQIFGGNNINGIINGDVSVIMHGGDAGEVFGGNNLGGEITGTITVTIDSNLSKCGNFEVDDVYGGGNQAPYSHTTGNYPQVNIKNGTVRNNVFGGGLGAAAKVDGSPIVTLGGENGAATGTGTVVNVFGNVYGGGNEAEVEGTTQVVMFKGQVGKTSESDPEKGNIFGGGKGKDSDLSAGMITGNTQVVLKGGTVEHNVYGGGHLGQVTGNTDVQLTQP